MSESLTRQEASADRLMADDRGQVIFGASRCARMPTSQPLGDRVMDLGEQPVPFRCRCLGPGPFLGYLVHVRVGEGDRRGLRRS